VDLNVDTSSLFSVFGIEVTLGLLALTLIAADLLVGRGRLTGGSPLVRALTGAGLLGILAWSLTLEPIGRTPVGTLDAFALFFKRFFLVTALLTLVVQAPYDARLPAGRAEFPALVVFTTLGLCMLASVKDFVGLFVGLELATITLFLLAAYRPGLPRSIESGLKFVVVGALAAAFMVYGIAFIYGATGALDFAGVSAAIDAAGEAPSAGLTFGMLLLLAGLGFKLGAVPFHVWIPDVYQGAPTPVTAFLSTGSKAAGLVLLMRLVYTILGASAVHWASLIAVIAAATLVMGNFGAIPQVDLKRFLGYSGIAHAGFLLIALATGTVDAASALLFYIVVYLLTNMAAFMVVVVVSRTADDAHMDRVNGLARRSPFLAFILTASLLSLAGVPPLAGFFGKFMILRAAMANEALWWLVALGLVTIVVSLYYYLCVIKRIYMREPEDSDVLEISGGARWMMLGCVLLILILGVYQKPLVDAATAGARALAG